MNHILILGTGVVGLSLAWHLKKYGGDSLKITLIDSNTRVGGRVKTQEVDSALYELGPHTIRLAHPYKEACEELFKDLGLEDEVIRPGDSVKKRYIGYRGKLNTFPGHPLKLLRPDRFMQLIFPLLKEPFRSKSKQDDLSIHDFITERFNPYIRDYLVDPMVSGIFGGDIKKLSLKSCFPLMHSLRDKKGLLIKHLLQHKKQHPACMISFKEGLATLPNTIYGQLDAEFKLGQKVQSIDFNKKPTVYFEGGSLECDHLFSCLPAPSLYPLLKEKNIDLSFLTNLRALSYKVIHLGFKERLNIPEGFGLLTPPIKNEKIAGVIFDSNLFEEHNSKEHQTRLTVMLSERSPIFDLDESSLLNEVLLDLESYFGFKLFCDYQRVYTLPHAMAQYELGHEKRLKLFESEVSQKLPNFSFLGSSFYGASIPSCIQQGKEMALKFCKNKVYTA